MKRLFLSAGHSTTTDSGAIGVSGIKEGDLSAEFRKLLVKELTTLGVKVEVDADSTVTGNTVRTIVEHIKNIDVAIDLHFNAYHNPKATGTEVLIPFKYSDFESKFGSALSVTIATTLNIVNRGLKTEANSARGRLIFMTPNCENLLLELCFISNPDDLAKYQSKKEQLASNLAKTILTYLNK